MFNCVLMRAWHCASVAILVLAGVSSGALQAAAQAEAPGPRATQQRTSSALEEILVTAERREANLQEVPLSISSFGSLAFSSHVGFSSLGKLLVIGVTLTLVCNLVVLPALIVYRARRARGFAGGIKQTPDAGRGRLRRARSGERACRR